MIFLMCKNFLFWGSISVAILAIWLLVSQL